ncbi:hypothetical protein C4B63_237g21 [Trypanosoma cruzi]|uniref:DUF7920 domain-containing protein n=1 Tax=Trypanosoma cruzi TaxID=5693 RepID=A0A2V2UPR6_TRYCR|nr:hypothetical protein C4B63_237g21 [Trypanosoma cruzi]
MKASVPIPRAAWRHRSPFGLDVVTPQPAVELGTDEYAALRDGMARRLNCEGAVVYGCNEAGVVVRMWKQRSHAYAMERAAQEAIVTHRLCGVALRSRLAGRLAGLPEEVRQRLGDWEAERLDYLARFAAWLHVTGRQTARTDLGGLQDLRRRWITLQNQFTQCVAADAHVRSQVMHYEPSGGRRCRLRWSAGLRQVHILPHPVRSAAPGTAFAMLDQPRRGRRKAAVS